MPFPSDTEPDTEIEALLARELERQTTGLQLIASENFTSPAVLRAVGSVLTNKYSEGYPGKRYYGGNAVIDDVEALAIERVKALFGAEHANVQPHSGANANMCVYQALLEPGDTVLGLSLDHGGHLTHGSPVNASGLLYHFVAYKVTPGDERIDMDQVRDLALEHRPKMIVAGTTELPAAPRPRAVPGDRRRGRRAVHVRRRPHRRPDRRRRPPRTRCRTPTSSRSRRTRRCAARAAAASCRKAEHAKAIDKAVFPGWQGGPLEHVIAGKAVAFREAAHPSFKEYAHQIVDERRRRSPRRWRGRASGWSSGGTDNHLMVVDLRPFDAELTGKDRPDDARRGRHHAEQEHHPRRPAQPVRHERPAHRHAVGDDAGDGGAGDGRDRRASSPPPCATATDARAHARPRDAQGRRRRPLCAAASPPTR